MELGHLTLLELEHLYEEHQLLIMETLEMDPDFDASPMMDYLKHIELELELRQMRQQVPDAWNKAGATGWSLPKKINDKNCKSSDEDALRRVPEFLRRRKSSQGNLRRSRRLAKTRPSRSGNTDRRWRDRNDESSSPSSPASRSSSDTGYKKPRASRAGSLSSKDGASTNNTTPMPSTSTGLPGLGLSHLRLKSDNSSSTDEDPTPGKGNKK